jgi:hypothetical protein
MKIFIFLSLIFLSLYSCKQQNKPIELSVDRMYIVEWRWSISEKNYQPFFKMIGFSELTKNFKLKCAIQASPTEYRISNILIEDSLKSRISEIIEKYPSDTTFCYQGGYDRMYDGNSYAFIFQKKDSQVKQIYLKDVLDEYKK